MTAATTHSYHVPDISCEHCVKAITDRVAPLEGVEQVDVNIAAKTVTVTGGQDAAVVNAISAAGYSIA